MGRLTDNRGLCARCRDAEECEYYAGEFSSPCPNQKRWEKLRQYEDLAQNIMDDPQRYGPWTVGAIRQIEAD